MLELLTALIALPTPANIIWGTVGAAVVYLLNKKVPSTIEKKTVTRDDFTALTSTLFKDIEILKNEIERYKKDSETCEQKYEELSEKFTGFKRSYNELELRYSIQIKINKKLADEILHLEEEVKKYLDRDSQLIVDDRQESINKNPEGTSGK